jgi:hypothetical protein
MNLGKVMQAANTHGVMRVGVATGLVTAITGDAIALAHLLGDWKFDVDLAHAVRTHIDPNHDVAQVIGGLLALTLLILVALFLTAIGRAPQIPDKP